MKPNRVIALTANTCWYLFNFRLSLAKHLRELGYSVAFIAPKDEFSDKLVQAGFNYIEWPLARAGMNPFHELYSLVALVRIYSKLKPQLVHHFTIKAVLYGSVAARILGVKAIVNSVTGLGHVFINQGFGASVLRKAVVIFYRLLTSTSHARFIFQNQDDVDFFKNNQLVSSSYSRLIKGSGVDINRFTPKKETLNNRVVFIGRLLKEKGIYDFLAAARIVAKKIPDTSFWVAGSPDVGNPSSMNAAEVNDLASTGLAKFLGQVDEIEKVMEDAALVVLPSYREGLPRVLLEAGAMEKGLIASDVPGCREIVIHNQTGLLVPIKDSQALADAIEKLLLDKELRRRLGSNARKHIAENLSDPVILKNTLSVYQELLSNQL